MKFLAPATIEALRKMILRKPWFSGRGLLVPVILFFSAFIAYGNFVWLEKWPLIQNQDTFLSFLLAGFHFLISGIMTWIAGRDFITVDNKRVEIDLNNIFLCFKMKFIGKIFFTLGAMLLLYSISLFLKAE